MQRRIVQGLVVAGISSLCVAQVVFAITQDATVPEIDAGSAVGALTVLVGTLSLLGERLRRK